MSEINASVLNFVCLHFAQSDTVVLSSLELFCITQVANRYIPQPEFSITIIKSYWEHGVFWCLRDPSLSSFAPGKLPR